MSLRRLLTGTGPKSKLTLLSRNTNFNNPQFKDRKGLDFGYTKRWFREGKSMRVWNINSGLNYIWQLSALSFLKLFSAPNILSLLLTKSYTTSSKINLSKPQQFDYKASELYWSQIWKTQPPNSTQSKIDDDKTYYILSMFPYPSGNLHMGHVRVYTISDTLARFWKLKGYKVLHPMGWDAFGLPAENAAMHRSISPQEWTDKNVAQMRDQFELIHTDLDWHRELNTSSPSYYQWTQRLILDLYDANLLYRKEGIVNWDPVDKTVLANEQVDNEGRSWRSGAVVEKRKLTQWYVKITEYAEDLLADLEILGGWPDKVKLMQKNWIGKSTGAQLTFPISNPGVLNASFKEKIESLDVFTSRPETLSGVSYLAVSMDHPIIDRLAENKKKEFGKFKAKVERSKEGDTKLGFDTGLQASNPLTGASLPIYAAPYVLSSYGTGIVMGVPAHDNRDHQFSLNQPSLCFKALDYVIGPNQGHVFMEGDGPFVDLDEGVVLKGELSGLNSAEAGKKVVELAEKEGYGCEKVQYRLKDWLISRQRYWGTPLPFVHCPSCGIQSSPSTSLPILLPTTPPILSNLNTSSPLASDSTYSQTSCPSCHGPASRDPDTMDTFVDSSWYYLRFTDPDFKDGLIDIEKAKKAMPVDLYIGGIEHAILHLLYARFISKFVAKKYGLNGIKGEGMRGEPFKKLLTQGMVQGKTYKVKSTGQFVNPEHVDLADKENPVHSETGQTLMLSYEKMSKSKFNGIDPKETIDLYGVDATRLYVLSKAPPEDHLDWDSQSVVGTQRFLQKIYKLILSTPPRPLQLNLPLPTDAQQDIYRHLNQTIQSVTISLEKDHKLNTAVSDLIKLVNKLTQSKTTNPEIVNTDGWYYSIRQLLVMAYPFAPSSANSFLNLTIANDHNTQISQLLWPQVDSKALQVQSIQCVVQVNGKKKFTLQLPTELEEKEVIDRVMNYENRPEGWLTEYNKVFVRNGGKIVNFVITK